MKVLMAQLKMIYNMDTDILKNALSGIKYASHLATILSQQDQQSLVMYGLKTAELLLRRLPEIYRYHFYREGVVAEIEKLGAKEMPAANIAALESESEEDVVQEKTMFNVKLESFEAGSKPKIIKEVKSLLGLSLVDSKKFVESAPKILKEGLSKEDAEKIMKTLQDLGAKIVLE